MKSKSQGAAWYTATVKEVCDALGVDLHRGLSPSEVRRRRRRHGINRIYKEEHTSFFSYLGYCSSDLMLILLLVTAAVAAVFGEEHAASVIIPILIFSIAVRTFAYIRARRYLESASSAAAVMPSVTVLRGGAVYRIDGRQVVRGDILRLKAGDIVPADCRIISAEGLSVYETGVTGAPGVVEKTAAEVPFGASPAACVNMLFAGSSIFSGKCVAVTVEVGAETLAVRSRGELSAIRGGELKITRLLERYSRVWGAVMTLTVFLITILNLIFGDRGLYDVFFMGLALAVASMCEYYSAMGDIAAAFGLAALAAGDGDRLRRNGSFVRGVRSIEALADLDVIVFSDNGVITADGVECRYSILRDGKLTDLKNADGFPDVFRFAAISTGLYGGALAAGAVKRSESSRAIDEYIKKNGFNVNSVFREGETPMLWGDDGDGLPFDVQLLGTADGYVAYMNGDAVSVIERSLFLYGEDGETVPMTEETREGLLRAVAYHEHHGATVVGIARKVTPFHSKERLNFAVSDVSFVGFLAFYRPLAPDTENAVKACHEAGIRLVMAGAGRQSALTASRVGIMSRRGDMLTAKEFAAMDKEARAAAAREKTLLIGFDASALIAFISILQKQGLKVAYVGNPDNDTTGELRLLHGVGASFALSHEMINYQNERERLIFEDADGVSQTLKMSADNIVPRANREGGGLPSVVECASFAKKIYENVASVAEYLVTSQAARMLTVLYSAVFHDKALSAAQILLWGLIFDFFAVLTICLERPDYKTLRRRSDVYEKLKNPFSGISVAVAYGFLWGAVTMLTANIFYPASDMSATVIFVSIILSLLVVCGEERSEYSVFSKQRSINLFTCIFIASGLLLIILITVSPAVASAVGIISPDPRALLVSAVPAVLMLAVYELPRFIRKK